MGDEIKQRPVAFVSGASRRVGACIARTLHTAGYNLAIHFRHSAVDATSLASDLERARPNSTLLLQADLCDVPALESMVRQAKTHFGRLDAIVNNASAFFPTPAGTATESDWDEIFKANARAPFFLAQAAAPALRASRGSIVSISDIYAERPLVDHAIYAMSKAALEAMTRCLALELAPDIRVNAIAPGAVLWPAQENPYEDQGELVRRTPLKRAGSPEDIARTVLWLLRDATFVTGQTIRVDGGRTLAA